MTAGSTRSLSTDSGKRVVLSPGWQGRVGPRFVDMGDGVIAAIGMFDRRIVSASTGEDVTQRLMTGRRFVAFRMNDDGEVTEIGPPTICPGDVQAYWDGHYTHEYPIAAELPPFWFDGSEGTSEEGTIAYMGDDVVLGIGLNGLDPQFPNGYGDPDDDVYSAYFELRQCVAWVARLNRSSLEWTVGPMARIVSHSYPGANYFDQQVGINYEDLVVGVTAMTSTLATMSVALYEFGLGDIAYDPDGTGDPTNEGINRELETNPGQFALSDMDVGLLRLYALRVDPDALTVEVINVRRVTDRMTTGGWFAACDEPWRLTDTRGALVYHRPDEEGWVVVWNHDSSGAIVSSTSTRWTETIEFPESAQGLPASDEGWVIAQRDVTDYFHSLRVDWDTLAHKSYYFGSTARLSETLIVATGNETNFYNKFLFVFRINGDDSITITDRNFLAGSTSFRSPRLVRIGPDGWIWVSFQQTIGYQKASEVSFEGYDNHSSPLAMAQGAQVMSAVRVDLTSGRLVEYRAMGRGPAYSRYIEDGWPTSIYYRGRGYTIDSPGFSRAWPYGADNVILGDSVTLTLSSPLSQTFPITSQEQYIFASPGQTDYDLWWVDGSGFSDENLTDLGGGVRVKAYGDTT